MPEFFLAMCLPVTLRSWKYWWSLQELSLGLGKTQLPWHAKLQDAAALFPPVVDNIRGKSIVCVGCDVSKSLLGYWATSEDSDIHKSILEQRYEIL